MAWLLFVLILVFLVWGVIAFYRSYLDFTKRKELYHFLYNKIEQGQQVSPDEYASLTREDQLFLQLKQKDGKPSK